MQLTITVQISKEMQATGFNYNTTNQIANTVRRTAHAIEGCDPYAEDLGGAVLDAAGKVIGTWSIDDE